MAKDVTETSQWKNFLIIESVVMLVHWLALMPQSW